MLDGVTDDLPAFDAMLAAMPSGGGIIQLPPGIAWLSDTWHIAKPVQLRGLGGTGQLLSGFEVAPGKTAISVDEYGGNASLHRISHLDLVSRTLVHGTAWPSTISTQQCITNVFSNGDTVRKGDCYVTTSNGYPDVFFRAGSGGTFGGAEPAWNVTVGATTTSNGVTYTTEAFPTQHAASTTYNVGDRVFAPHDNRFIFECTASAGAQQSAATPPAELTGGDAAAGVEIGGTVTDGDITWLVTLAAGIYVNTDLGAIDHIYTLGFTGAGIHAQGGVGQDAAGMTFVDNCRLRDLFLIDCGLGVYIGGSDANGWSIHQLFGIGLGNFQPSPMLQFTATTTLGSTSLSSISINTGGSWGGAGTLPIPAMFVGQFLFGDGIPLGTTIAAITSSSSVALSAEATASAAGVSCTGAVGNGGHALHEHSDAGGSVIDLYAQTSSGRPILKNGNGVTTFISCYEELYRRSRYATGSSSVIGGDVLPDPIPQAVVVVGADGMLGRGIQETDKTGPVALNVELLPQDSISALKFFSSDENGNFYAWQYGYQLPAGWWGLVYGNQGFKAAFAMSGTALGADPGPGWFTLTDGMLMGPIASPPLFDGPIDTLTNAVLRGGLRRAGDRFRRATRDVRLTTDGYRGVSWPMSSPVTAFNTLWSIAATVVEPIANGANPGPGLSVYQCTAGGTTGATEPNWGLLAPNIGNSFTEAGTTVEWTNIGTTPDFIESYGPGGGQTVVDVTGADVTLADAQGMFEMLNVTGANGVPRAVTFPAPTTDGGAYRRVIRNQTAQDLVVGLGAGATVTVLAGTATQVGFDAAPSAFQIA